MLAAALTRHEALETERLLRIGLRSAELLAFFGNHSRAREVLETLEPFTSPEGHASALATRAELAARSGNLYDARGMFENLRASEPRGSELSIRAALGLARVAESEGLHAEARGRAEALTEDLAELSPESPQRPGLEAALRATSSDDLAAALADADAWLNASRDALALPFRRPFPGALVLSPGEHGPIEVN